MISRLEDGLEKQITLISAPAGYGKTTIAAQWLNNIPYRSAWLSLESNDNELERFIRYAVAAVGEPEYIFHIVLSNRELDVLVLLEKRYSNKDIAQQLYISPNTVKKHTINIYRKLEVNSRRQAIASARLIGLLPEK